MDDAMNAESFEMKVGPLVQDAAVNHLCFLPADFAFTANPPLGRRLGAKAVVAKPIVHVPFGLSFTRSVRRRSKEFWR